MKCYECGKTFREIHGDLEVIDNHVGPFWLEAVHYYKCDECGEVLFPPETARAIEKGRIERKDQLLRNRPLNEFLTATETAAILGISRQALHKHRRIRRGFIHQTTFGSGIVYLKESVMLFKMIGDGRILLYRPTEMHDTGYVDRSIYSEPMFNYEPQHVDATPLPDAPFQPVQQTSNSKDVSYAK